MIQNLVLTATVPLTVAEADPDAVFTTECSELMFSLALVTSLAFAVLALFAVMRDVVDGRRREALVDPLTGLLNRRGLAAAAGRAPAARTGGEEFVLYLSGVSATRARTVADDLRAAMRRYDWSSTGRTGA